MSTALKWKLIVGFLLVFFAGAMTGSWIGASRAREFAHPPRHSHKLHDRMRERLQRQLDLTPDQIAKVAPIIDQTASKLEAIREESARRVGEIFDESHRQIAPELTAEQRTKLEQLKRKHRKEFRHRKFRRGEPNEPSP